MAARLRWPESIEISLMKSKIANLTKAGFQRRVD